LESEEVIAAVSVTELIRFNCIHRVDVTLRRAAVEHSAARLAGGCLADGLTGATVVHHELAGIDCDGRADLAVLLASVASLP